MSVWNKFIFGGIGWALGGPIGAIIGFALGALSENFQIDTLPGNKTHPGDFGAALLVLCAAVMKSDNRILKSELEFVKDFFVRQFGVPYTKDRMLLFREIIKQEIPLEKVCNQIREHMDYPSRLQLIHLLFGVSNSDGEVHPAEIQTIFNISGFLQINLKDFESVKAMFVKDFSSAYKILEVEQTATDEEIKKSYRKLAALHHPDKVHHLGDEFRHAAQEKFKAINEAYNQIKKERVFK